MGIPVTSFIAEFFMSLFEAKYKVSEKYFPDENNTFLFRGMWMTFLKFLITMTILYSFVEELINFIQP